MLIDTHCHLNSKEYESHEQEYYQKALNAGVNMFFVVAWDITSSELAINWAENYNNVYAIVGIHPCDIDGVDLHNLERLLTHPRVVALGEIGLDYHWVKDETQREKQRQYFIEQIDLANKYHLPISIHSRDAIQDTLDILKTHKPECGFVMHCFSGSKEMMNEFLKLGGYISFGGPVTFKNAVTAKECACLVPFERLLIETDCPYLTPHPFRGQQNDPSYLPLVAKEITALRNINQEELENQLEENTKRFFRL